MNADGDHGDTDGQSFDAVDDAVPLSHGSHAAIALQIADERFSSQFRLGRQRVNRIANFLADAAVRDLIEHQAGSSRDDNLVNQKPSSFLTCSQG